MSNVTAMSRVKSLLIELASELGPDFKMIDFHGRDEKANNYNDQGFVKAVTSDYIRIYKNQKQPNLKTGKSFSIAFNNFEKENSGVIVSVKDNSKQEYSYLTFSEFKAFLKVLVTKLKSCPVKNADTVNELISQLFNTSPNECSLEEFYSTLQTELLSIEKEYCEILSQMNDIRQSSSPIKKDSLARMMELNQKESSHSFGLLREKLRKLEKNYVQSIQDEKKKLLESKPYLTSRLIGKILQPLIAKGGSPWALKDILSMELSANASRMFTPEYSD